MLDVCSRFDTDRHLPPHRDRHRYKPVGDLVRALPLSKFRGLPFRNKGLNQNSVETLYAGNVGHHYTKISENWIKNCRMSSILRDPSEK